MKVLFLGAYQDQNALFLFHKMTKNIPINRKLAKEF